ncbi:MAG: MFS transporter [Pseudotabrizicola sp.]|uniref:MFS transporter n=1 Tax=Pseudotabrizicola sp. TaxID=2939647 RepID=UPI00272493B9|nr:MFS transporter [Pseudotabrizicola sp.]MDO8883418.1 MFS transporter [Pseudotabrizicola sp.]MDP2082341.1 MFS transporter [Pseudotabrizicola sp.]MDZ7574333.1 MFS transporter [Pseudotabrizicola sp.]
MANKFIPLHLKHAPAPKVQSFALLSGLEAAVRGTLVSAMPLAVYDALGSAEATSSAYFVAGIVSLIWGLMVPWATRHIPRRWMYTLGCGLYLIGMSIAIVGTGWLMPVALTCLAMATATTFVCLNAYILDYIDRQNLGRSQSMQMVFAAGPWAIGPLLGVWLRSIWAPLPFVVAGACAILLLTVFWVLRLGNGKQISRAKGPAANPLAYLGRFFAQPRLIAGWLFAVMRSCGWWVYVVYLPIFCIEAGLGDKVGGVALSLSNALLFASPVMLRYARSASVRRTVRFAFGAGGMLFLAAAAVSPLPWATVLCCMAAAVFLVLLDIVGGLPFLMAVKPSERTEMSAVYSSFRDVSGILTPGAAWLVLLVAPLPGIFAASGVGLVIAWAISGRLHPRLGVQRVVQQVER